MQKGRNNTANHRKQIFWQKFARQMNFGNFPRLVLNLGFLMQKSTLILRLSKAEKVRIGIARVGSLGSPPIKMPTIKKA